MNTIKIFLAEDGSIADLRKDFDLYQYEYQNKLLNVFVPTSICAAPFVDDNITTGTSCQIKMEAQNSLGAKKISANFYMRIVATENAVKKVVVNGVEYYIFERLLPYAFTIFSGTGVNAPKLTISICNISIEQGGVNLISVINTQTCYLTVNPSTQVQSETPQDPSDLDSLFALYNDIATLMPLKQNADTTNDQYKINPNGDNHTVVANINDLLSDNTTNKKHISELKDDMDNAKTAIENLYTMVGYGVNVVGTWTVQDSLPTDLQVTAKVEEITGNPPIRGQALIVRVDYTSGTDTIYLYVFDGANWAHFEMQFLNSAENNVKGLIEGTYNAATTTPNTLMVSITNGAIDEIYYIDSNGHKERLSDVMEQAIAKVVLGTSAVNMALKDGNGNNIASTYMTKQEGASKDYVKDYASPKALYDLNYPDYALGQFKSVEVSDTSYNKTTNSTSVGYTTLATITKSLEADILLGDQNGLINRLWISANITEDVKLRITTAYIDGNNQTQTLSVEETDTFGLVTGIAKLLQIESVFSGLTQPITLPAGTTLVQTIEVWREASASADFTLLSNTTYNAYMTLNKIGYVRYALEQEPSGIETGHDNTPTIDSDGDLLVQSTDGKMHYANGGEQEIATILKVPMASGINANDVRPPKAGDVKTALDNTEIDITSWGATLTNAQYGLITTRPLPKLVKNGGVYVPVQETAYYFYWSALNSVNVMGMIVVEKSTKAITSYTRNFVDEFGTVQNYAPLYTRINTYSVGDLAIYDGILYKCNTAITSQEDFNPLHWDRADVKTLLNSKQTAPSVLGTAGQVLGLDSNLNPEWQTPVVSKAKVVIIEEVVPHSNTPNDIQSVAITEQEWNDCSTADYIVFNNWKSAGKKFVAVRINNLKPEEFYNNSKDLFLGFFPNSNGDLRPIYISFLKGYSQGAYTYNLRTKEGYAIKCSNTFNTALANKLSIVSSTTTYDQVYGKANDGTQTMFDLSATQNDYTIPMRVGGGALFVGTPTDDNHATPKSYVDNAIASAITTTLNTPI